MLWKEFDFRDKSTYPEEGRLLLVEWSNDFIVCEYNPFMDHFEKVLNVGLGESYTVIRAKKYLYIKDLLKGKEYEHRIL